MIMSYAHSQAAQSLACMFTMVFSYVRDDLYQVTNQASKTDFNIALYGGACLMQYRY